jgi:hypothetical protein
MRPSKSHKRLVALSGRYAAGLLVALIAAMAGFFSTASFAGRLTPVVSGFAGVFLGCLCLERRSWLAGSVLFTVLGLAFYLWFWSPVQFHMKRFAWSEMSFPLMPGLALGGFLATAALSLWRCTAHSQQGAAPNVGPASHSGGSGVREGPPSVS